VIATTHEVDYVELDEHELASWQRWFWACPQPSCEETRSRRGRFVAALEYYVGRPVAVADPTLD
jgi:hypothetical protein